MFMYRYIKTDVNNSKAHTWTVWLVLDEGPDHANLWNIVFNLFDLWKNCIIHFVTEKIVYVYNWNYIVTIRPVRSLGQLLVYLSTLGNSRYLSAFSNMERSFPKENKLTWFWRPCDEFLINHLMCIWLLVW